MRRLDGGHELSDGLVAFWPMDEPGGNSWFDISNYANHGRGVNGPARRTGRNSTVTLFDGADDYVSVPAKSPVNLSRSVSLSVWINPAGWGESNFGRIIDKDNGGNGWAIYLDNSFVSSGVGWRFGGTTGSLANCISLNVWQHLLVTTPDANNFYVFVNGVLRGSGGGGAGIGTTTTALAIGNRGSDTARAFNGQMANLRLWNKPKWIGSARRLWADPWAGTLRDPRRVWYLPTSTAITGSGAITFADMAVAGTGVEEIPGSGAITFGVMTTAGSGELGLSGSGALTFAPMTTAGSGTLAFVGSGAITFGAMATSGAGLLGIAGAGALTFASMGVSGSGAVAVAGSGALTFAPMTVSGVGYLPITGAGALTFGPMTIAGVGAVSTTLIEGSGAIVFDAMSISGVGLNSAPGPTPAPAPVRRRPALSAIPLPTTPWVIPLTGNLTPVAYQFLFTLMRRTGGQPGKTTPDDQDALPLASLLEGGGEWANVSQRFEFAGDTQTQTLVSLAETERLDASSVQVVLSDGQVEPPAQIVILGVEGGAITDAALLPIATPQSAPLPDVLTPGASPWTFDAPGKGFVLVEGGTVSAITISRDGTTNYATGMTGGFFPVDWQDQLTVTYTVAPNVTFFGSSYDA